MHDRIKSYLKLLAVVLLLCITANSGVYGCMKKENDTRAEQMLAYAVQKYGRDFNVKSFRSAKDDTYTDILTLDDGEYIFNVYQRGEGEMTDNYSVCVASKKSADYLRHLCNGECDIFAHFIFSEPGEVTLSLVLNNDAPTLLKKLSLTKLIVVTLVRGEISEHSEELFGIYKQAMSLEPKYIDFEMLQVEDITSELSDALNGISVFYDDDWNRFPEVRSTLSVTDTNIVSAHELTKGGR